MTSVAPELSRISPRGAAIGISTKRRRCGLHIKGQNVFRLSPIACAVGQRLSLVPFDDVTIRAGS
ncbi:MAG: hypothetical protein ACRDNS_28035, partial [Trebonia sp.]